MCRRTFRNAKWPPFWQLKGPAGLHKYSLRLIWEIVDLPLAAPVVVNAHEAHAFCAWCTACAGLTAETGFRLLAEVEHARVRGNEAAVSVQAAASASGASGAAARRAVDPAPSATGTDLRGRCNLQLSWGSEAPVDALATSSTGFVGASGNVWHWCEDWISALPGSHGVHPYYDDFTTPCYDGQHSVIMGGSFMSTGDEASRFARFHFRCDLDRVVLMALLHLGLNQRNAPEVGEEFDVHSWPHFHQHAGFRIVRCNGPVNASHIDSPPPHVGSWDPSSSTTTASASKSAAAAMASSMLTHFAAPKALLGPLSSILPESALDFPSAVTAFLSEVCWQNGRKSSKALEIGCGVGGVAMRLAQRFDGVMAVDLEAENIAAATHMQTTGSTVVRFKREGLLHDEEVVTSAVPSEARRRVLFKQMDPCCLAPDIGSFDAVVINGVIDRTVSPKSPLGRMGGVSPIVNKHGLVMVISAYDWDDRVCDSKLWLGGWSGAADSRAGLSAALGSEFRMLASRDVPVVYREHARKFELVLMDVTIWSRDSQARQ